MSIPTDIEDAAKLYFSDMSTLNGYAFDWTYSEDEDRLLNPTSATAFCVVGSNGSASSADGNLLDSFWLVSTYLSFFFSVPSSEWESSLVSKAKSRRECMKAISDILLRFGGANNSIADAGCLIFGDSEFEIDDIEQEGGAYNRYTGSVSFQIKYEQQRKTQ